MIKLTVNPGKRNPELKPAEYIFAKSVVIIGSGTSHLVDLRIPDDSLQPEHVKIFELEGRFVVLNNANDPFVTLNGSPFWKMDIANGDKLHVANVEIIFDGEVSESPTQVAKDEPIQPKQSVPDLSLPVPYGTALKDAFSIKSEVAQMLQRKIDMKSFSSFGGSRAEGSGFKAPQKNGGDIEDAPKGADSLEEGPHGIIGDEEAGSHAENAFEMDRDVEDMMREVEEMDSLRQDSAVQETGETSEQSKLPSPSEPLPPANASENESVNQGQISSKSSESALGKPLGRESESEEDAPLEDAEQKELSDSHEKAVESLFDLHFQPPVRVPVEKKPPRIGKDDGDRFDSRSRKTQTLFLTKHIAANWKQYAIFFAGLIIILMAIAAAMYLSASEKRGEDELKAAHSVSDIAMALTSSHIQHIKPLNQNWYDPEFLKKNIRAVLASKYSTMCHVDTQGNFNKCPYILRIYTNTDTSRFLLIAQPEPSVMRWLIPKAAIVVDSQTMQLRKLTDLKELNRLINSPHTLDGSNAVEISNLVLKGELISLDDLAEKTHSLEFAPPAELAFLRPGAENLIYNAPRYYKFSEPVLQAAIAFESSIDPEQDVSILMDELQKRAELHDLVFYTSQGLEVSIQAQKALAQYGVESDFLVGYLTLHPKNGLVVSSHLLVADNLAFKDENEKALAALDGNKGLSQGSTTEEALVDRNNLVFMKLRSLAIVRQKVLDVKSHAISALLQEHNQKGLPGFVENFQHLFEEYSALQAEQHANVLLSLDQLYGEYVLDSQQMTHEAFFKHMEEADLDPAIFGEELKTESI